MRLAGYFLTVTLIVAVTGFGWAQSVQLHDVEGLNFDGTLKVNETIRFNIGLTGDADYHIYLDHGFRIYSPDGAEWTTTVPDSVPGSLEGLFPGLIMLEASITGSGADTVGFVAINMSGPGLPPYYDGPVFALEIGPIDESHAGKTIVLDSSWYPPGGDWVWGYENADPTWGGPYTFTVGELCQEPFAYMDPEPVTTKVPVQGFVDIYFGNFCEWEKDVNEVDLKSIKIDAVKPRSTVVVQNDPTFGGPAIRATISLKNFLKPYEPLTGDIEGIFRVTGKFLDRTRFVTNGDFSVIVLPGGVDLNNDGVTDEADVKLLADYLYQNDRSRFNSVSFDVDGNGRVDTYDLQALMKLVDSN